MVEKLRELPGMKQFEVSENVLHMNLPVYPDLFREKNKSIQFGERIKNIYHKGLKGHKDFWE
jgi:hypothetical protein